MTIAECTNYTSTTTYQRECNTCNANYVSVRKGKRCTSFLTSGDVIAHCTAYDKNNAKNCTACESGYYLDSTGAEPVCVAYTNNCVSGTNSACTGCADGYLLIKDDADSNPVNNICKALPLYATSKCDVDPTATGTNTLGQIHCQTCA